MLRTNTSGFLGVNPERRKFRKTNWVAEIIKDGIRVYLGAFEKLCDAVYSRYIAEVILFQEFRSEHNDENIMTEINQCENKELIKKSVIDKLIKKGFTYYNI